MAGNMYLPLIVGWVISLMVKLEEERRRRQKSKGDGRKEEKERRERSMRGRRKGRRKFTPFGRTIFVLFRAKWGVCDFGG